ncbi:hypothetical protein [Enterococcus sp. AZ109]|uniref:hypothetical protein n=1 Tax=Enterococcus sp. AZ109 TaxID=2774634 RepID=UPI003F1EB825
MAKIVDITEQLNFEDNPKIKIKDEELEVHTDAATALKLMGIVGDGTSMSMESIAEICQLLFSEENFKKIENMNLQFKDFTILVRSAMTLIIGEESSGE